MTIQFCILFMYYQRNVISEAIFYFGRRLKNIPNFESESESIFEIPRGGRFHQHTSWSIDIYWDWNRLVSLCIIDSRLEPRGSLLCICALAKMTSCVFFFLRFWLMPLTLRFGIRLCVCVCVFCSCCILLLFLGTFFEDTKSNRSFFGILAMFQQPFPTPRGWCSSIDLVDV